MINQKYIDYLIKERIQVEQNVTVDGFTWDLRLEYVDKVFLFTVRAVGTEAMLALTKAAKALPEGIITLYGSYPVATLVRVIHGYHSHHFEWCDGGARCVCGKYLDNEDILEIINIEEA